MNFQKNENLIYNQLRKDGFIISKEIEEKNTFQKMFIDVEHNCIAISNVKKRTIEYINFDDIEDCKIIENSSIASGGIGRAIIGTAIAGGVGAIVGAATRGQDSEVWQLDIMIMKDDVLNPIKIISLISKERPISKNMNIYNDLYSFANNFYATILSIIKNKRKRIKPKTTIKFTTNKEFEVEDISQRRGIQKCSSTEEMRALADEYVSLGYKEILTDNDNIVLAADKGNPIAYAIFAAVITAIIMDFLFGMWVFAVLCMLLIFTKVYMGIVKEEEILLQVNDSSKLQMWKKENEKVKQKFFITYMILSFIFTAFLIKDRIIIKESVVSAKNLSQEQIIQAIKDSDDYNKYQKNFLNIAQKLIRSGKCSLKDFKNLGGFVKSSQKDTSYFVYCGGMKIKNKIYVDAKTEQINN